MNEDHCYNCEAMFPRLQKLGYLGSLSVLKAFVHPLRPPQQGQAPVQRFETKPGEQVQFDWVRRVGAYEIPVKRGRGRGEEPLGHPTDLERKRKGENSMLETRRTLEGM